MPAPAITPHLWYDKEAKDAARLYTSVFRDARTTSTSQLHDTPSGTVDLVSIELLGVPFSLISAGPYFTFNPSISFIVRCTSRDEADSIWNPLAEGGTVMMELGEYPFSERFGWVQDRFGLSWQVFTVQGTVGQRIVPKLMFTGDVAGKAEEAIAFYRTVFQPSGDASVMRHPAGSEPDVEGTLAHAECSLDGFAFAFMDSARPHGFRFNEAVSFIVHCDTQEEIDHYWDKLSAVPQAEQCGWLKDRYGVSWQIVPRAMSEMMSGKDKGRIARVTKAFLKMKKLDIAALQKTYEGS